MCCRSADLSVQVIHHCLESWVWQLFKLLGPFMLFCFLLDIWGEFAQSQTYTTDFIYSTRFGKALVLVDLCLLAVWARLRCLAKFAVTHKARLMGRMGASDPHHAPFLQPIYICIRNQLTTGGLDGQILPEPSSLPHVEFKHGRIRGLVFFGVPMRR